MRHWISFPFIFLPLIPVVFLDFVLEIYHRICFPLYGLPYIKRENYMVFDRFRLTYITMPDKIFCMYCSYVNGFLEYAVAVAGETEKYWCGIKHKSFPGFVEPRHQKDFAQYGNVEDFKRKYMSRVS